MRAPSRKYSCDNEFWLAYEASTLTGTNPESGLQALVRMWGQLGRELEPRTLTLVGDMLEAWAMHPVDWTVRRRPRWPDGSWLFNSPLEEARYALTAPGSAGLTGEHYLTLTRCRWALYADELEALVALEHPPPAAAVRTPAWLVPASDFLERCRQHVRRPSPSWLERRS